MRKLFILTLALLLLMGCTAHADVLGVAVDEGADFVDLTHVKGMNEKVNTLLRDLEKHPSVTTVDLRGVYLSTSNKATLAESCPGVTFLWTVELGNAAVTTGDTVLDLDTPRGEVKLSEIARTLRAVPSIERVIMHKYRPSLGGMRDYLLEVFPDVQFDWTLYWWICNGRAIYLKSTDTAFSTMKGRQDPRYTASEIWSRLQYFPDLLAIDVGHNNVSDLTFLTNFPKLRRLIVIDSKNPVKDLSPLAELMDLEYVELFMQEITDLSPLANHTNLMDLNLCTNNITDLTPLYSCTNLKRLWIAFNPNLTMEEIEAFQAAMPECEVVYDLPPRDDTGGTWRLHPHYDILVKSFEDNTYYPFEDSAPLTDETEVLP